MLITGAGAVGQTILTAARPMGASRIAVSDPDPFARSFSLEHGADQAFDPSAPGDQARFTKYTPDGFDLGFETSGSPRALHLAIQACSRGATIVQIGTLPRDVPLPINLVMSKEMAFLGSFRFTNEFEKVLDLIVGRRISLDHLVTNVYPFEELPAAMEAAIRKGNVIKVQVRGSS